MSYIIYILITLFVILISIGVVIYINSIPTIPTIKTINLSIKGESGKEIINIYMDNTLIKENFILSVSPVSLTYNVPVGVNTFKIEFINDSDKNDVYINNLSLNNVNILDKIIFSDNSFPENKLTLMKSGKLLWNGTYSYPV